MKLIDYDYRKRLNSLQTMERYVYAHAEPIGIKYWEDEIHNLTPYDDPDEVRDCISRDDEKYIDVLFIFYISVTVDTSWLNGVADAYISKK